MPKKNPDSDDRPLSKAEQFYIKEHRSSRNLAQLASDLSLPVAPIKAYISLLDAAKGESRIAEMMRCRDEAGRKRGVTMMNEGASMMADDDRGDRVTAADVKKALANRDYDLAADLQKKMDAQDRADFDQASARHRECIHVIRPTAD